MNRFASAHADHESMPVFRQAAVAHLGEAEDAFDHPDWMLDARPHAGLPPIGRAQLGRRRTPMGEVACVGRTHAEDRGLPGVRRVARTVTEPGVDMKPHTGPPAVTIPDGRQP